jgi:Holliday junction resolvasome RuvABC endonuclease subunit
MVKNIVGIDPSFNNFGIAKLKIENNKWTLTDCYLLSPVPSDDEYVKIKSMVFQINDVSSACDLYGYPDNIFFERIHGAMSYSSSNAMGIAKTLTTYCVYSITPITREDPVGLTNREIRELILGKGKAKDWSKKKAIDFAIKLCRLKVRKTKTTRYITVGPDRELPEGRFEHIADAIATAYAGYKKIYTEKENSNV